MQDNTTSQLYLLKLLAFNIKLRNKCNPEKDHKKILSYNSSIIKILAQLNPKTEQNYYGA